MKKLPSKSLLFAGLLGLVTLGVSAGAAQQNARSIDASANLRTSFPGSGGIVVDKERIPPLSNIRPKPAPTSIPPDF